MAVFWWVKMVLVPVMGRATSNGVFCHVCKLSMTLGSLSVNWWGCVLVFLVVSCDVSSTEACWPLGLSGS